jgi:hypothetical protein
MSFEINGRIQVSQEISILSQRQFVARSQQEPRRRAAIRLGLADAFFVLSFEPFDGRRLSRPLLRGHIYSQLSQKNIVRRDTTTI